MKIVLSWLREFAPTDLDADELAELVTRQGVKVEKIERPWDGVQGVVVAEVLEVSDHPDSDKLCVTRVDDGTGEQVVCAGVRNFVAGDLVPWAKPGSRVPSLPEPLAPRKLRGVLSNGMLCSSRELNIADIHEGILVLNDEHVQVGQDVVAALGLDDAVLDIEVEPNRPDFLSVFGVAREVAAATGVTLVEPDLALNEFGNEASSLASVRIDAPQACPRYVARIIRGVDASRTSPVLAQARLTASGMRPVSAIVDATNYTMLESGQPLHAFDMGGLAGPGIVVRHATDGERLKTLDGLDRELTSEDLLICDLDGPVALGGVMGGASSEVSEATTDVLLESAYFSRIGVLRTVRRLGLHSEAAHRFERGTDPEGLERAASRCAGLITAWTHGEVAPGVSAAGQVPARHRVSMRPARASMLLDYEVTHGTAGAAFDRLGLGHEADGEKIEVEVPGYRVDIQREVDLIEEVARIEGYDRIGVKTSSAAQLGGLPEGYRFRERMRDALVRAGLRDVRPLPFASDDDLALTADRDAIAVANPLQAEEGHLRTWLLPGLLRTVARNQALGVEVVALFETGTVFALADPVDERARVAWILCGPAATGWDADHRSTDVLDASGVLAALMDELGISDWTLGEVPEGPFHPGRSAAVLLAGEHAGVLAEIHPRVAAAMEIEGRVAFAELEMQALLGATSKEFVFREVPRFPPVRRDLAFVVGEDVAAGAVEAALREAGGDLLARSELFDVFRGGSIPERAKSLAFTLEFRAPDRTLTGEQTEPLVERMVAALARDFGAQLRSG